MRNAPDLMYKFGAFLINYLLSGGLRIVHEVTKGVL